MTYIITDQEAFHDEPVEFTLEKARKTKRDLQKYIDGQAAEMDAIPDEVKIYKLIEVR